MAEIVTLNKPPGQPSICETATAVRILKAVQLCHRLGWMGAIVGPPGVGKTVTLRHYAESEPAWFCTAHRVFARAASALELVATTVGAFVVERGRHARFEAVVHAIRETRRRPILIFDEAQEFEVEAINAIRGLHDATGLPIVFAGNSQVINQLYLRKGNVKPAFEQLESRLSVTLRLEPNEPGEVVAFARHNGISDPRAHAFLIEEAKRGGNLRRIIRRIEAGRLLAGDGAIQLRHLKDAAELCGSGEA